MPRLLKLGDDGDWQPGDVEAEYRELWALAEAFWDSLNGEVVEGGMEINFTRERLPDAALLCLRTNYRVGKAEADLLGLFDHRRNLGESKACDVLRALVDCDTFLELKKKLDAVAISSTDDGQ